MHFGRPLAPLVPFCPPFGSLLASFGSLWASIWFQLAHFRRPLAHFCLPWESIFSLLGSSGVILDNFYRFPLIFAPGGIPKARNIEKLPSEGYRKQETFKNCPRRDTETKKPCFHHGSPNNSPFLGCELTSR